MFEEFTSRGVKHQKRFWTANKRQCLTEVCKTANLRRLHSFAETCKTNWFSRGPNGFCSGNVINDTFVKWLSSGDERKWGRCMGADAMADELAGRKDQQRQWQRVPRLNDHPWRRCIAEVKPLGSGLEARQERSGG
jgi:hypothetical protein